MSERTLEWDRPIALPLYRFWPDDAVLPWQEQEPDEHGNAFAGRLIIWRRARMGPEADGATPDIPMPRESVKNLGPQDIVFVPLFDGADPSRAMSVDDRLPDAIYQQNLQSLYEIAPRVKCVIMGNCGPELCFCDMPTDGGPARIDGRDKAQVERLRQRHLAFIRYTGSLVRGAGGTPAWAPVPAEFMFDLYMLRGELRKLMQAFGGALVQFLGFGEWDQQFRPNLQHSPHYCPNVRTGCDRRDLPPDDERYCERICSGVFSPNVANYLTGWKFSVCGMEFKDGLARGNDIKAAEHGFQAGLVGWN